MRFAERFEQLLENMITYPGHETENKVVWPCLKVFWSSKDDPTGTGHSENEEEVVGRKY